jgi:guanylate kinase
LLAGQSKGEAIFCVHASAKGSPRSEKAQGHAVADVPQAKPLGRLAARLLSGSSALRETRRIVARSLSRHSPLRIPAPQPKATFMRTPAAGNLFIVAAPSGAGKSTLVNALLAANASIALSTSYTTRPMRPAETQGREYHFIDVDEFKAREAKGEFIESAEVHGNFYGTSRVWIEEKMATGDDVLLEIDWQGARQVRSLFPGAVGIFILPPSIAALEERLRKRGQDSAHVISRRLLAAGAEMAHVSEFEYVIINQDFPVALEQLAEIVNATRLRFHTQAARHAEVFHQLGISAGR